jgi:hypothetical protein
VKKVARTRRCAHLNRMGADGMKSIWLRTSSGVGLLVVALGILLARREDESGTLGVELRSGRFG